MYSSHSVLPPYAIRKLPHIPFPYDIYKINNAVKAIKASPLTISRLLSPPPPRVVTPLQGMYSRALLKVVTQMH